MKRKVLFLFLGLILLFVVGCSSDSDDNTTSEEEGEEPVEISYMTAPADSEGAEQFIEEEIIGAFEEDNPDIDVNWITNEDPATLQRQQLASGGGPDVILMDGASTLSQFQKADYLVPLDEYADEYGWSDRYADWAYDIGFSDGELYGLPSEFESLLIWYNKDLFEQNGWEPPNNFEEFMSLNQSIHENGQMPFSFGTTDFRTANEWWLSVVFNAYVGPERFKEVLQNKIPWTDDVVQGAVETYRDMWQEGYISDQQSHAISTDDAWSLFYNEQSAMHMEGTWSLTRFSTDSPSFEVDYFVMPPWREDVEENVPIALGESGGINANSEHTEEAARFLDWYYGEEIAQKWLNHGKFLPVNSVDPNESEELGALGASVYETLQSAFEEDRTGYAAWTYWGANSEQYLWENIDGVLLGETPVEEYLEMTQEQAERDEEEDLLFEFEE
ncbi:extracellular solute-binding protein [Gracilibacillus salitolerans]|uniref:Extracellular solute-binding protein n=1 Tax=Gracilibacillus salitolerans TaxID=2663022 RepID=A0A5Q2TND9_9BACI|nr:extracellular solute-binding protein [Gracilibacillus salitolerans]QGH36245.1 extracellular solute-binding protein [Gracilibacillus salitolerans]